jgi:hypothetical protein
MIPAPPGLVATYVNEGVDNLGKPYKHWDCKPVIAFNDEGVPLIVGDRKRSNNRTLIRADTYTNYDGVVHNPDPPFVSIIPADGWRVARKDDDGTEWSRPLIGWAVKADGEIAALETDPDGLVEEVGAHGRDSSRIYHPDEPSD